MVRERSQQRGAASKGVPRAKGVYLVLLLSVAVQSLLGRRRGLVQRRLGDLGRLVRNLLLLGRRLLRVRGAGGERITHLLVLLLLLGHRLAQLGLLRGQLSVVVLRQPLHRFDVRLLLGDVRLLLRQGVLGLCGVLLVCLFDLIRLLCQGLLVRGIDLLHGVLVRAVCHVGSLRHRGRFTCHGIVRRLHRRSRSLLRLLTLRCPFSKPRIVSHTRSLGLSRGRFRRWLRLHGLARHGLTHPPLHFLPRGLRLLLGQQSDGLLMSRCRLHTPHRTVFLVALLTLLEVVPLHAEWPPPVRRSGAMVGRSARQCSKEHGGETHFPYLNGIWGGYGPTFPRTTLRGGVLKT